MNTIILKSIDLDYFKGIRSLHIDFEAGMTSIYGDNATGKTTVYDALTWLLFGKDSSGSDSFPSSLPEFPVLRRRSRPSLRSTANP